MRTTKKILIGLLLLLFIPLISVAQESYNMLPEQLLKVEGTSTIHDWHMDTKEATGAASILVEDGIVKSIESMKVNFETKSLKSGKGGMDKNAYKALNEKKHKNIEYELVSISTAEGNTLNAEGKLTIAGQTREISFPVDYVVHEDGTITFSGEVPISFEMFDLKPPTAVFGTIKTGNDLKLSFETTFVNQQ